jgi:hypothetical protein
MTLKSAQVTEDFHRFISKLIANRIINNSEEDKISKWEAYNLIVKYFKLNNDRYIELIKLQRDKR